jgi:hypothetical protein
MANLMIRKAHFWGGVPSAEWLSKAVLLYDKVLVEPAAEIRAQLNDPTFHRDSRDELMKNLEFQEFIESLGGVTEPYMSTLLSGVTREQAQATSSDPDAGFLGAIIHTLKKVEEFHPEIDFYGHVWNMQTDGTIMSAVETFVPAHPEKLSRTQIVDFRGENELRRARFMSAADELIASFGEARDVEELTRVLRLTEKAVAEEYQNLEVMMRKTKIEYVGKAMGLSWAPPAVATALASLLAITPIAPLAAISSLSLVAAQVLQARDEVEVSLRQSPWSYLWELKRL